MTTRCPVCEATIADDETRCPKCGAKPLIDAPHSADADYLAQDRWSLSSGKPAVTAKRPKYAPPPKQAPPQAPPSAVGYAGHRDVKHRYDMTVELATPLDASRQKTMAMPGLSPSTSTQQTQELHVLRKSQGEAKGAPPAARVGRTMIGVGPAKGNRVQAPPPKSARQISKPPAPRVPRPSKPAPPDRSIRVEPSVPVPRETAPQEIKLELDPHLKREAAVIQNTAEGTRLGTREPSPLSVPLGLSAMLLLAVWFIPDIWQANPELSFHKIGITSGLKLIALVARPIVGAILLVILIVPINMRLRAGLSLLAGLASLALPLIFGKPPLPTSGATVLALDLACLGGAAICYKRVKVRPLGHLLILLVPGALFALAVAGIALSKLPASQLSLFKEPASLFAGNLIASHAASVLLKRKGQS